MSAIGKKQRVTCDICNIELTRHHLKRHKRNKHGESKTPKREKKVGYSDEEDEPKKQCLGCNRKFTTEGLRVHKNSTSACQKRVLSARRPVCGCDVPLMLDETKNDVCHGCEERSKVNEKVEAEPIQLHQGFSKIFAYCPNTEEYKDAPMLHMEDIKNQIFKSAFLVPGETPMHLRVHEPIIIPDENEGLRDTAKQLITYQEGVKTFCVHSKFWKALLSHAKKCTFIKSIKSIEKLRTEIQRLFGLQDDGKLDAQILYWLVFSPHASVFHDIGSYNCFIVHPIVSLSGHIRVWSTKSWARPKRVSAFYHYLKRIQFLTTEGCPCSCDYDEEF